MSKYNVINSSPVDWLSRPAVFWVFYCLSLGNPCIRGRRTLYLFTHVNMPILKNKMNRVIFTVHTTLWVTICLRGFHKVVGGKALSLFRPEELELLICGNPHLDFGALEENSKYEDGYTKDDPVVKRFWEVCDNFVEEETYT